MEANDRRLERLRPPMRRRYSAYDQPRRSTCWDRPLYGQQHYVDFDSRRPRRHLTCWDPPSRTSAREEIHATPLPEPPSQSDPNLLYGSPPCGISDTHASEHTTRPSFQPLGFLTADSAAPRRPQAGVSSWRKKELETELHGTGVAADEGVGE